MCSIPPTDKHSLAALEQEICELAAHLAAATCRWLLLIAEFDERLGWAEWGVHSCAHWLSWRCSIGLRAAREHVRVARRLGELALIRDAFAAGELSYCKVRAIARVATAETEQQLLELARHATGAQLERLVRGYRGALAATLESTRSAHERRHLNWSWDDDGSLRFEGRLTADAGALFLAALAAVEDVTAEESANGGADAATTPGVRRADALVVLSQAALAGTPAAPGADNPFQLLVHVDAETLAGDEVRSQSELGEGPALAPETVRRLGCDGSVVRIIERDGEPLSVSRRSRAIPPAIRRALQSRDRGCRFPGCTHTRFLHAHHIQHWARGGPTRLANLVQLCSYHHHLVHEGGFMAEPCEADGVRFRRPDGRLIAPGPVNRHGPQRGAGVEAANRARGLSIGPDTCRPLSAGDRLDYDIAVEGLLHRARPPDRR